ncbi:aminotransferase class V-fold PLP-dependent enzyme [Alteromonas sp. a30]|uniref:aminotransferase class V-fold PLP-dependent enzyme n=1 Tax=Alteromonas sp. a30 TaxID=2730917 RepID=UPI00227DEB08|nr:aminotransferase class V-fold PLP-dependent enzyme [Alteromonas sp. a30]MCY7293827.1 aminotransferase class V-fold PLP-dependent enzyme [Alteromonas sp. a30]
MHAYVEKIKALGENEFFRDVSLVYIIDKHEFELPCLVFETKNPQFAFNYFIRQTQNQPHLNYYEHSIWHLTQMLDSISQALNCEFPAFCLYLVDDLSAFLASAREDKVNLIIEATQHLHEYLAQLADSEGMGKTRKNRVPGDRLKQANQRLLPLVYESNTSWQNPLLVERSDEELWCIALSALQIVVSRFCYTQRVGILTQNPSFSHYGVIRASLDSVENVDGLMQKNRCFALLAHQLNAFKIEQYLNENERNSLLNISHNGIGLRVQCVEYEKDRDISQQIKANNVFSLQKDLLDIQLNITRFTSGENISKLVWAFNSNKYSPAFIQSFEQAFICCLQHCVAAPQLPVNHLPIVEMPIEAVNQFDDNNSVISLFESQVEETPDAIALYTMLDGMPVQWGYRELNQSVNRMANLLLEEGVTAGARVGVLLNYSPEILVSILAIFKLNAEYVPFDPEYPSERLNYMLQDANVDWMLTAKSHLSLLQDRLNDSQTLKILQWDSSQIQVRLNSLSAENLGTTMNSELAYVVYTSGTTGQPKGVLGTHRSLANRLIWMQSQFPAKTGTRFGATTSVCFVDHIAELLQPIICGGIVCMLPDEALEGGLVNDADMLLSWEIERLTLLPSLLLGLLRKSNKKSLSTLKLVVTSGEPLFQNVVDAFHSKLDGKARLINLYGTTECGADVSFYEATFPEHLRVMKYFKPRRNSMGDVPVRIGLDDEHFTMPNVPVADLIHKFMDVDIPAQPADYASYIEQIKEELFPYLIDVSSKKFIGHMTSALPDFMSDFSRFITQANQNIVKIETSKVLTFMERQLMAMLHKMFFRQEDSYYAERVQNPAHMFGVVTSGGSLANVMALYSARNKALMRQGITKEQIQKQGAIACMQSLGFTRAVILVSRLAHYSIRKTVGLLGLGEDNLLIIEQDEHQRIDTQKLAETIAHCKQENRFIIALIGIAGATETGTVDPLPQLASIANENHIHFHVDAAWGGAFVFSEDYHYKLAGIEHADTITFCAHKQLYLAQGISLCLFKNSQGLYSVTTHAEYQAEIGSFDLGQFTLEGSRPATSLMLHAALHLFSRSGYNWLMQQSMLKAAFLKALVQNTDAFELVGENDLNIINYRYIPRALRGKPQHINYTQEEHQLISEATESIQIQQFLQGRTFVSKTRILYSQFSDSKISVFRVVPINPLTSFDDLIDVLNDQLQIATALVEGDQEEQSIELSNSMLHALEPIRPIAPIGKAIANNALYVMDEFHNLLPPGAIGEIYVAGAGIAKGYLNKPDLTRRSFIVSPFNPEQRLYRTFDLGRVRHDGQIEYCGRVDHQIKLHGNRIELDEIEMTLKAMPQVAVAKVALLQSKENSEFLEQDSAITAYIEPNTLLGKKEKHTLKQNILDELRLHLPEDHLPQHIVIFDKIPMLPNFKVDLNLCEKLAKDSGK